MANPKSDQAQAEREAMRRVPSNIREIKRAHRPIQQKRLLRALANGPKTGAELIAAGVFYPGYIAALARRTGANIIERRGMLAWVREGANDA